MANLTGFGCRFIEEHQVSADGSPERMTRVAGNVFVSALQWKSGLVVVEERRLPLVAVVASGAIVGTQAKLVRMRVLMTIAAVHGGFREFDMHHCELHAGWPVASDAGRRAMRSNERKVRAVVIERREIFPFLRRMAGLAPQSLSC